MRNIFNGNKKINIAFLIFPVRMLLTAAELSPLHRIKGTKIRNIGVHVVHVNKNALIALHAAKARAALALVEQNNKLPVQK